MGFFSKISEGLKKTRDSITNQMDLVINSFTTIDEDLIDELEETMIMSDVGTITASKVAEELRRRIKRTGVTDPHELKRMIRDIIAEMLEGDYSLNLATKPSVILVIGVNGAGKTTSIGKMACRLQKEDKKVLLAAADTFRAAAIDQLQVWADRAQVDMIRHEEGSDPAAVVFDALQAGKARGADVIICDTAGRLHNKKNLMDELAKIRRIIDRELPDSSIESLLVLDATTGQNALNQAKQFKEVADITGIILTKLDGTAKGGVVVGIKEELGLPIKFIGVGEQIDDLREFDPLVFATSLIAVGDDEESDPEEESSY